MLANKISDSAKKIFVLDDHKNGNNPDCDGTVAFAHDTAPEMCYYGCIEWITAKGWKLSDEKKNPDHKYRRDAFFCKQRKGLYAWNEKS